MNSQVKKLVIVTTAGVAAALVLTACTRIVNNQPVVGGPNGIPVQTQSTTLEQAPPTEQYFSPVQRAPEQAPVIVAPATTTKAEEKPAAPVPAAAAETAKASEQMQLTEKAAAQAMHHCSGFDD